MSQLILPLKLADHAIFDTFWRPGNEAASAFVEALCEPSAGPGCWLWGASSSGKSHLLQAVCARVGSSAQYLPIGELRQAGAAALEGMSTRRVLCFDDLHLVAGRADWEEALFRVLLEAAESEAVVVVAAAASAREAGFLRDDVKSRFAQLTSFQLMPLDDDGLQNALKLRARHRGLELPDETARFLLVSQRREMASLYDLLDRLYAEAMVAKRRLTVPFVKSVLDD